MLEKLKTLKWLDLILGLFLTMWCVIMTFWRPDWSWAGEQTYFEAFWMGAYFAWGLYRLREVLLGVLGIEERAVKTHTVAEHAWETLSWNRWRCVICREYHYGLPPTTGRIIGVDPIVKEVAPEG